MLKGLSAVIVLAIGALVAILAPGPAPAAGSARVLAVPLPYRIAYQEVQGDRLFAIVLVPITTEVSEDVRVLRAAARAAGGIVEMRLAVDGPAEQGLAGVGFSKYTLIFGIPNLSEFY